MKKKKIAITFFIMCMVLTCMIVVQLNIMKNSNTTVGQTAKENSLRDEVLKWKEKYEQKFAELEKVQKQLENERTKASANNDESNDKQKELKLLTTYLGLNTVEGEGITITIKDNTSSKTDIPSNYLIHDGDLREIVNELKNTGAEAISINDQRIVSTSAITCIGNVVQINGEKVGSPFVIKAIGQPESLLGALLRPGGYLEYLKDEYGITNDTKKSKSIKIEKYNGVLNYKYMESAE